MANKVVLIVTAHVGEKHNGEYFLKPFPLEHANELGIPNNIHFEKNTKSFVDSASIIKEKITKIQEILDDE